MVHHSSLQDAAVPRGALRWWYTLGRQEYLAELVRGTEKQQGQVEAPSEAAPPAAPGTPAALGSVPLGPAGLSRGFLNTLPLDARLHVLLSQVCVCGCVWVCPWGGPQVCHLCAFRIPRGAFSLPRVHPSPCGAFQGWNGVG